MGNCQIHYEPESLQKLGHRCGLCKILFPRVSESRGRTDLRFLMLSVMLGLIACGGVGVMLWVMNYYSSHSR